MEGNRAGVIDDTVWDQILSIFGGDQGRCTITRSVRGSV